MYSFNMKCNARRSYVDLLKADPKSKYRSVLMYGSFSFMVETDDYTAFSDGFFEPIVLPYDSSDYRVSRATHGYEPWKGPQPCFLATGPNFKQNVWLSSGNIIDEAPTFAKILGVDLPKVEGVSIDTLLL